MSRRLPAAPQALAIFVRYGPRGSLRVVTVQADLTLTRGWTQSQWEGGLPKRNPGLTLANAFSVIQFSESLFERGGQHFDFWCKAHSYR